MKKQFKNILKINLIIGKKQNLAMRKKKAVSGRNIIIANGEKKKMSLMVQAKQKNKVG